MFDVTMTPPTQTHLKSGVNHRVHDLNVTMQQRFNIYKMCNIYSPATNQKKKDASLCFQWLTVQTSLKCPHSL